MSVTAFYGERVHIFISGGKAADPHNAKGLPEKKHSAMFEAEQGGRKRVKQVYRQNIQQYVQQQSSRNEAQQSPAAPLRNSLLNLAQLVLQQPPSTLRKLATAPCATLSLGPQRRPAAPSATLYLGLQQHLAGILSLTHPSVT